MGDVVRVLVTGASGFVGSHVVDRLARDPEFTVLAGRRDGAPGSVRLDVTDAASVTAAVRDVDALVHCAVGDRAVTVDGTARLLDAASAAGVRRVVHLSSVAVYGDADGRVTEETPLITGGSGYAAWKADAERLCLRASSPEVIRLRPTIVYGAGSALWVETPLRRIRSGRWGTLGAAGEGICNPVHVTDVAEAVARALQAGPEVAGRAFNINGPETLTWNAWFNALAGAAGLGPLPELDAATLRRRRAVGVPLKALRRAIPAIDPDYLLGVPAASESALFARTATYPTEAAGQALGWQPRMGVAEGVAGAVR